MATIRRCVLCVSALLLVVVGAAPGPAMAANSTATYTASLSPTALTSAASKQSVTVTLTNSQSAQQSFGSAQIDMGTVPVATPVTAYGPAEGDTWTATVSDNVSSTGVPDYVVQVDSPSNTDDIGAGQSLYVTLSVTPPGYGVYPVGTQVKQSNDFNGPNNQFTLSGSQPSLVVEANNTGCTSGATSVNCSSQTTTDGSDVTASLQITADNSTAIYYTEQWQSQAMSCDNAVDGNSSYTDQFFVDAVAVDSSGGTVPTSKTLSLTFPKSIVDLFPANGTPDMPICLGSDYSFPGGSWNSTDSDYEGLLYTCTDATYLADQNKTNKYQIFPCVQSRSKSGLQGGETVVVYFPTNPYDWAGAW